MPPEILNLNYLEFKERCKDPNFKQLYDLELEVPDPLQEKEIENDVVNETLIIEEQNHES